MKIKRPIVFGLAVVISLGAVFVASCKKTDNRIRVGAAIALTGYGATFGQSEVDAIALLKEKYPQVEFFVEDNKSDPKAGLSAVRKLVDVHKVDIVYCELTSVANAITPVTRDAKKVLLAAVYLSDLLDKSPYAIRNLPKAADEATVLLNAVTSESSSIKTIAALGSNDEFGRGSVQDFEMVAKNRGLSVTYKDSIPDDQKAIASVAAKVASSRPDAVYLASLMPSLGTFIKELRIAGFKGEIMTTDAFVYPYIRDAAGEYAKGTVYADFATGENTVSFAEKFRSRFQRDLSPPAVLCYDGLSLLIDAALESAGTSLPEVVARLEGRSSQGVYGEISVKGREVIYPIVAKRAN